MERSILLKAIISELPLDEQRRENPKKTCQNCYNRGSTLIPLGYYWADARCRYCEGYSNWCHVASLLDEIREGKLAD
jgi:hypothetical protein